jgi:hypothetical protein
LQHVLHTRTGLEFSAMDLMQGLTVAQLASRLLTRIVPPAEPVAPEPAPQANRPVTTLVEA